MKRIIRRRFIVEDTFTYSQAEYYMEDNMVKIEFIAYNVIEITGPKDEVRNCIEEIEAHHKYLLKKIK